MSRLLVVSNRLPVTVGIAQGKAVVTPSMGGLATGLRGPFERSQGLWIGWPGDLSRLGDAARRAALAELEAMRTVPVELTPEEVDRYYEDFSNGVLWPLFHYLLDRIPLHSEGWDMYMRVNAKFADAVVAHYRPGDVIWVQDYQLLLLPGLLRKRLPDARIGFFLHIPFPASEVFRLLPWREDVLRGMLGADLVGFHTPSYTRHFASATVRVLGHEPVFDELFVEGRRVRFRAYPMGIDAQAFAGPGDSLEGFALRPGERLLLGVDRLDYTKGIRRRLTAVERVLERRPDLRGKLRMVQIAVPSREKIGAYEDFRRRVEQTVGRINGRWSTLGSVPIHYLYKGFPQGQLISLYRAASVMLVTPLRDGMNLVAKEFAAARTDGDGVLVLSEFAGAAEEMSDALIVNPTDVDDIARAIERALDMEEAERRSRMAALRGRVMRFDVHRWAEEFLAQLQEATPVPEGGLGTALPTEEVLAAARRAERLVLLLDYDGTLVPIVKRPELAVPDRELLELLGDLSKVPGVDVHVISGRPRVDLEKWLGDLPLGLHVEHGMYSRVDGAWRARASVPEDLRERVRATLEHVASCTPGSRVEIKAAGLAWHYREVEREHGAHQAHELRLHLRELLVGTPLEVLAGNKVVEVRPRGIHKGLLLRDLLRPGDLPLAIGDDRTDEDMFRALPPDALTVRVGVGPSAARYRLPDVAAVRALLRALARRPARA